MDCSCSIDSGVDDFCTVISDSRPKARKEHTCNECGGVIAVGQVYRREIVVDDGRFTHKTCLICNEIRNSLFETYFFGMVLEGLRDQIIDSGIPEHCIAELSPDARAVVCEIIEDTWDDD